MSPTKLGSGRFLFGLNRENEEFVRPKELQPGVQREPSESSPKQTESGMLDDEQTWDAISLPR